DRPLRLRQDFLSARLKQAAEENQFPLIHFCLYNHVITTWPFDDSNGFLLSKAMVSAYLDAFSGLSGDMLVGALADLGIDFQQFKLALESLGLRGYQVYLRR